MFRKRLFLSSFLILLLGIVSISFGQGRTGSIEGTVTDSTGAVIPGATIMIQSTGTTTGFKRTVTSNSDGYFSVIIAPGTYKVIIGGNGFANNTKNVTVVVDKASLASVQLQPSGSVEQIDVTNDSAVTIDTTDTKIDTNITKEVIDALPSGTTFGSLLKVAPNVRPETLGGGFQIDGASGSENVFVVDGQEVTNFRTGTLNSNNNLPFELLQEVQVKSTGFEAEYGGATGGVINVVTAGGNDKFHGNLGVSFTPAKLQGGPNPVLNRYGTGTGEFDLFERNKDGGTGFFPTASISGPIAKGKLWFSLTYAPQIFETSRTIDYYDTDAPSRQVINTIEYNQNWRTESTFFRLDAQPTSNLRLFGTFLWNPIIQDGLLPSTTEGLGGAPQSVFGGLSGADFLASQGGRQNSNSVNGGVTWTPNNWLVLNARVGRSFLNEKLGSYGIPEITRFRCRPGWAASATPGSNCNDGFQNVGSNYDTFYDVSTRTTFDIDGSLVGINLAGRHNFKVGYQLNRLFNTTDQGYRNKGRVDLFYGRDMINLLGVPGTPGNLGSGHLTRFAILGEASSKNQAIYAQDSWQIMNRLTLNLGIRFESEDVPSFGDGQPIEFGWDDKIAPRFGAAFDVFGNGKTKVFGSFGFFYDRFKYELPRGSFGGDFFRRDYFEILPSRGAGYENYTLAAILGSGQDPVGGTCLIPNPTGFSVCSLDFRIATNTGGVANLFSTGAVDPNIKAARQSEWTFGVEQELGNNFVLAGRYTHKQVDRAVEDIGVFNDQGSEAYLIGNPGIGLACEVSTTANQPCTKAIRDYDAIEIRVDKRSTKYFFNASYTWSRLFGNYSGLASSDEGGRTSPNVNRVFDQPSWGYNANGEPTNGRLATDRPHVFKAYGGYSFDWNGSKTNKTTISGFTTIQSGTPLTTIYTLIHFATTQLYGRGDLGRTEMFSSSDLSINHQYKFGRDNAWTFEPFIDILNLFDERNVIGYQTSISTTDFSAGGLNAAGCTTCISGDNNSVYNTMFNGGGILQYVENSINANGRRNTYNQPNSWQSGRSVRFGFRFRF